MGVVRLDTSFVPRSAGGDPVVGELAVALAPAGELELGAAVELEAGASCPDVFTVAAPESGVPPSVPPLPGDPPVPLPRPGIVGVVGDPGFVPTVGVVGVSGFVPTVGAPEATTTSAAPAHVPVTGTFPESPLYPATQRYVPAVVTATAVAW
jgi:hypothetical protein